MTGRRDRRDLTRLTKFWYSWTTISHIVEHATQWFAPLWLTGLGVVGKEGPNQFSPIMWDTLFHRLQQRQDICFLNESSHQLNCKTNGPVHKRRGKNRITSRTGRKCYQTKEEKQQNIQPTRDATPSPSFLRALGNRKRREKITRYIVTITK